MKAMLVVYLDDNTNLEELSADIHITNYVEDKKVKYVGNAEVLPIPKPRKTIEENKEYYVDENKAMEMIAMTFLDEGWNACLKEMLGNMYEVDDLKKWRLENEL